MPEKVKLQLVGLDSNAFSLLGSFRTAARRQGWSDDEIKRITSVAMEGDYDHLLRTLMDHCEDEGM